MTEGGYFEQKRLSPTGMAVVVLLHGAALTALLTAKGVDFVRHRDHPPQLIDIPLPPPPPPEPMPKPHVKLPEPPLDRSQTPIPLPPPPVPPDTHQQDPLPFPNPTADSGKTVEPPSLPPPPPIPVRDPIRTQPQLDPRSELQPPYPASAQREGAEGSVEIRLVIGADGRVKAAEKVRATRDDFYAATERQALRYWRFKPATVDGRPVESSRTMTVRFRLDDLG